MDGALRVHDAKCSHAPSRIPTNTDTDDADRAMYRKQLRHQRFGNTDLDRKEKYEDEEKNFLIPFSEPNPKNVIRQQESQIDKDGKKCIPREKNPWSDRQHSQTDTASDPELSRIPQDHVNRTEERSASASSEGRPEGSSRSERPRRSKSPLGGNPWNDGSGANARAPPSRRPVQNNNEASATGFSNLFRCFSISGSYEHYEEDPNSGGLSQSDRIAAAADSGRLPDYNQEDRNQSRGKAPAETQWPETRKYDGNLNHPPDLSAHKEAAATRSAVAIRKPADMPDTPPRDPPRSSSASKCRSDALPRKPASSHGTPKGTSPQSTPKSTSLEKIIVVPASQAQTTNSKSPTRSDQHSISASKLAIACACDKGKGHAGHQPGSQKSRVEAKMTRAGSERELVNEPVGLRAPRRAAKEPIRATRSRSNSRERRNDVESDVEVEEEPLPRRAGKNPIHSASGSSSRDRGKVTVEMEEEAPVRRRAGKEPMQEGEVELQEEGAPETSPGGRRGRRSDEEPGRRRRLKPSEGDIILRERKLRGLKMIEFFYPPLDDEEKEEFYRTLRKDDCLLRQRFVYSDASAAMELTSELWRAKVVRLVRDHSRVIRWEFVEYARRTIENFEQRQARRAQPPFAKSFIIPRHDGTGNN